MTDRKFILPYRQGSGTVRRLAQELNLKGIRLENSQYSPRNTDTIINWGNSSPPVDLGNARVLNNPERIGFVTNKLNFFRLVSEFDVENKPRIPEWTQNKDEALDWIEQNSIVFARTKLTGHSGEGIEVIDPADGNWSPKFDALRNDTLLVRYVKKKHEYRLHFFQGEIFDVQKKSKVIGRDDANFLIRNHDNGFIYSRNNLDEGVPDDVMEQARRTVVLLGLDFGAIDVIYNQMRGLAYVLEVNSAPGLEGTTLSNYVRKFREVI